MSRYDTSRNLPRNTKLIDYKNAHGDLSYEEIGREFGISRQRAWAIVNPQKAAKIRRNWKHNHVEAK